MKLVFAGDSITAAQYVTAAETFATRIAAALGYDAINSGVSGQTAAQLLAGISAQILTHAPNACIVMIGTNDVALAWAADAPNAPMVASYIAALSSLIDQLKASGIHTTVFSPPLSKRPQEAHRMLPLASALADLCAAKGVAFFDVAGRMAADARNSGAFMGWFLGEPLDNYHLSATGHQRIADGFLATQLAVAPPASIPPQSPTGLLLDAAPLATSFGNISGFTVRVKISRASFAAIPGQVTQMRFALRAHADEPMALSKLFFGPRAAAGDAIDAASLTALRVAGATSFTIPAGSLVWTDWAPCSDKTSDIVLSMFCNAGAASDKLAAKYPHTGSSTALKAGDEAAIANVSSFTVYADYLSLVEKVEADGF